MKISRDTLQSYFDTSLPTTAEIADAFTFHCFEIDAIEGDTLDVKVLPNRAADCSKEEGIAAELSAILDLPLKNGVVDGYAETTVEITLPQINATLGSDFTEAEVSDVFRRLRFSVEKKESVFMVKAPLPRTDIVIPEDLAEEVGRILDFERIPATELSPVSETPDQSRYLGTERMKDELVSQGFTEVLTQSFAKNGDIELANPFDQTKPWLRISLLENLNDALVRSKQYAESIVPPNTKIKLFEIGTVFPKDGEYLELRMTEKVSEWGEKANLVDNLSIAKLDEYGKNYVPKRYALESYKPFSLYPFITRDIALWVPEETKAHDIEAILRAKADTLLTRLSLFDEFKKDGRTSYAFRLVFQSFERTLTDEEINPIMEAIYTELKEQKFEIR